jgi:hypothetical protein
MNLVPNCCHQKSGLLVSGDILKTNESKRNIITLLSCQAKHELRAGNAPVLALIEN